MTPQIALLLGILAVALVLFAVELVAVDVVAIGILLALLLTGLISPERAFAGFGSDTVIVILGLLILTASLSRTGVVGLVGRAILRSTGEDGRRLPLVIMVAAVVLSAFISNTAATAFLLPVVLGVAAKAQLSSSKLLMPLAFASILASSLTLISTSTNILVSGLMRESGLAPLAMFELTPVGIAIAAVGIVYLLLVGRRLVPDRGRPAGLTDEFGLRPYLTELIILPASGLAGKTLTEAGLGRDLDLTILAVVRSGGRKVAARGTTRLEVGDVLLVEGERDGILAIKDRVGVEIKPDVVLADPDLQSEDLRLVEAILQPGSPLIGRTLSGARFRERYGLQVLGINRHGYTLRRQLSEVRLQMGDLLLLQGPEASLAALLDDRTFRILGEVEERRPRIRRAPIAVAIFVGALALATLNLVPLPGAILLGVFASFLTRCITPEEAYREVEWRVLILIASLLALGTAMEQTGTAAFLAERIARVAGPAGPLWLLSGFFAVAVLLTQPMSNQAAAAVLLPVAVQTAVQLGWNPRTFAVMIAVAASTSFITPLEPACLLVYGPGRYRFVDFPKVGALLTVLIYLLAILLVPRLWPL